MLAVKTTQMFDYRVTSLNPLSVTQASRHERVSLVSVNLNFAFRKRYALILSARNVATKFFRKVDTEIDILKNSLFKKYFCHNFKSNNHDLKSSGFFQIVL